MARLVPGREEGVESGTRGRVGGGQELADKRAQLHELCKIRRLAEVPVRAERVHLLPILSGV